MSDAGDDRTDARGARKSRRPNARPSSRTTQGAAPALGGRSARVEQAASAPAATAARAEAAAGHAEATARTGVRSVSSRAPRRASWWRWSGAPTTGSGPPAAETAGRSRVEGPPATSEPRRLGPTSSPARRARAEARPWSPDAPGRAGNSTAEGGSGSAGADAGWATRSLRAPKGACARGPWRGFRCPSRPGRKSRRPQTPDMPHGTTTSSEARPSPASACLWHGASIPADRHGRAVRRRARPRRGAARGSREGRAFGGGDARARAGGVRHRRTGAGARGRPHPRSEAG